MALRTTDGNVVPISGAQKITDMSAAGGTALTVPAGANGALIQCLVYAVRWYDDGTAPTAIAGMQLGVGNDMFYMGDLSAIKFFEEDTSSILEVSYYRVK